MRGHVGPKQAAFANLIGHGGDVYLARYRIKVFSGTMFGNRVHFFRQVHLLNHVPFIQRLKTRGILAVKFIFDYLINLFRLKRWTAAFAMAELSAAFYASCDGLEPRDVWV